MIVAMAIEPKYIFLGLLGLGAIAFLGYILFIASNNAGSSSGNSSSYSIHTTSSNNSPKYKNKEEIVWVDWKGRERRTIIHREVE
jgi:hypothetical protein